MKLFSSQKKFTELLRRRYRGFPVGVLVGIAIVASASVYAAPMLLSSKPVSKTAPSNSTTQQLSQSNNSKQSANNSTSTNTSTTASTNQSGSTTSSNPKSSNSPTSNNSSSTSTTTPVTNTPTKATPTMTGISVITPDPGQTEIMSVPDCDWEYINSGTPEVCHHYVPISIVLVANYSDGTSTQIPWSEATFTSTSDVIPKLFNIDETNNTLIEGNGMSYMLPGGGTYHIIVKYQGWSYIKYINFIMNGFWGS